METQSALLRINSRPADATQKEGRHTEMHTGSFENHLTRLRAL